MPMINLKDKQGNMKWIYVMPFRSESGPFICGKILD